MGHRNVSEVGEEVKNLQLTSTISLGANIFSHLSVSVHCYMSVGYVLSHLNLSNTSVNPAVKL
jgi:hypothetical protein